MEKSRFIGVAVVVLLICLIGGGAAFVYFSKERGKPDLGYVQGVIMVSAYPGTRLKLIDESLKNLHLLRQSMDILDLETSLYFVVSVPVGREKEFAEKVKEFPWVKSSDLNYTFQIPDCSKGPC